MALKVKVNESSKLGVVTVAGRPFSKSDDYTLIDLSSSIEDKIKASPYLDAEIITKEEHDKLVGQIEASKAKKKKATKARPKAKQLPKAKEQTPKTTKE